MVNFEMAWSLQSDVLHIFCSPTNGRFVQVNHEPPFSSKKLQALGWKFRPFEETLRDSVESFKAAGVLD
jgi:hypothetical protein